VQLAIVWVGRVCI